MRDQISQMRRELPWERVEKNYVFDGPDGKVTLTAICSAARASWAAVYHFMRSTQAGRAG